MSFCSLKNTYAVLLCGLKSHWLPCNASCPFKHAPIISHCSTILNVLYHTSRVYQSGSWSDKNGNAPLSLLVMEIWRNRSLILFPAGQYMCHMPGAIRWLASLEPCLCESTVWSWRSRKDSPSREKKRERKVHLVLEMWLQGLSFWLLNLLDPGWEIQC